MKDFQGREILKGDHIVYAVRRGSSMHLTAATVTDDDAVRAHYSSIQPVIKAMTDDRRNVTLGEPAYIVVLS